MARRRGRLGNYLMTSDYTGFVHFNSELQRDFWGSYAKHPLKRNLQEIASPLSDPEPVSIYRGPNYESFNPCNAEVAPLYVGLTNVPTSQDNMAFQALDLAPAIPDMEIGCTFQVY